VLAIHEGTPTHAVTGDVSFPFCHRDARLTLSEKRSPSFLPQHPRPGGPSLPDFSELAPYHTTNDVA